MKDYEVYSSLKVPKNSNIIIRLDGRNFHKLSDDLNLIKPYDETFYKVMAEVSRDVFEEFSAKFIYTFSDEINLLLDNIPFDGRVEKINSVIASFTASSFVIHYNSDFKKPPAFDSRIIPIAGDEIFKYFKWRQDESWRNCINSHASSYLKSKYTNSQSNDILNGMNQSEVHELLFENGIKLNDIETYKKRGIGIYRKYKKITGFNKKENKNQTSYRSYLYTDWELPKFSKDFLRENKVII